jgi:acetoin utilization protein AcuB
VQLEFVVDVRCRCVARQPLGTGIAESATMRLQEIMSSPVSTVTHTMSAEQAWQLMKLKRINHLLVLNGTKIVGVLSARDLGGANGTRLRTGKNTSDFMSSPVVTADPHMTVREAANKLRGRYLGCLPIVDNDRVVGIVTTSDLLELIGRGVERPIVMSTPRTLYGRGPRQQDYSAARRR